MKHTLLAMAMVIAVAISALGQAKDEQAIQKTINELMTALTKNDLDTVGGTYAEDYVIVLADGTTTTKAQRLAAMKSGDLRYQSLNVSNLKIRQYGEAAVATYQVTGKTVTRAGEQDANTLATVTLVRNGGRWQIVSSHLTDVASATPDEGALNKVMDDYLAALTKNSADSVESFLDARYVRIGGDGTHLNKEQIVAGLRSGGVKYSSVQTSDRKWRTFGSDTAIVTSKAVIKATANGNDLSGTYGVTTVLRRVGNKWVLASTHLSPAK